MVTGNFYYLKASYYAKFPNCNLIGNKDGDTEGKHDRPCFYCFELELMNHQQRNCTPLLEKYYVFIMTEE